MKWHLKNSSQPDSPSELEAILLANRGITNKADWFKPARPATFDLDDLKIDPTALKTTLKLLKKVQKTQGLIVIFGDYDADGITATAVLWRVLHNLGFNAKPFIPDRLRHGYGLTAKALEEIFSTSQPALVITVDNGIVAHEAATYLKQKKCPLVITDHHLPEATLPEAQAIFHSTSVCGAGVSWLLAREIVRQLKPDQDQLINNQLDLVGIATIADQMPLTAYNRAFAAWGIKALKVTTRVGLLELIKVAAINQNLIDSGLINYALAPRINAMGRLKNGLDALRLLCTTSPTQAAALAQELSSTNLKRQDLTAQQIEEALTQVESQSQEKLLIVQSANFHEGVIGLIAGKITEQFNKPVIVIALGEDLAKASARSLPKINIIELIRQVKTDLLAAGGHPMAAGFSLKPEKIATVKQKLQSLAQAYPDEYFEKKLELECLLPTKLVEAQTYHLLKTFEPFGTKNPVPIFGFEALKVVSSQTMGQDQNHLRLVVATPAGQQLTIIGWRLGKLAASLVTGQSIKVAGELTLNEWRGKTSVQITAKALNLD